jgi:hypothetical protein
LIYALCVSGSARQLKKVHRPSRHVSSIPAALIDEVAFLVCASGDIYLRAIKPRVLVGFFASDFDEIWSVRARGRIGLKSSSGTAMKLWGDSIWANISCYGKLALLGVLVFNDPIWTTVSPEASKLHAAAAGVVQTFENRTNVQIPPVLLPRAGATGTARPNGAIPQNNAPQNNMQQYYQQPQQLGAARLCPTRSNNLSNLSTSISNHGKRRRSYGPPQNCPAQTPAQNCNAARLPQQQYARSNPTVGSSSAAGTRLRCRPMTRAIASDIRGCQIRTVSASTSCHGSVIHKLHRHAWRAGGRAVPSPPRRRAS